MKSILLLICSVFIIIAAAGCENDVQPISTGKPVKVGVIGPLSGPDKEWGANGLAGIKTALKLQPLLNNGSKIELVIKDDQNNPELTRQALAKLAEDDVLIMLSDHGFEKLEKDVYVNHLLASEGFLTFKPGAEPGLNSIDSATKAFALDPARIFINQKDKYPAGSVAENEKETCLKDLENLFSSLEIDGKKVIKHIHRKQDVYTGPYIDNAADLILIAENGFNLKGAMTSKELTAKGPFTGKHTYEDAFLMISNQNAVPDFDGLPTVIDAGALIKSLTSDK